MSADKATQGSDFDGLEWVRDGIWGSEPCWTVEPDEEAIKQTVGSSLNLTTAPCDIKFLAQGAFNKVYIVTFAEKEVIARVTLPVDPKWKTLSEVATLEWVRENTSLPVPEVISYQADRTSAIGFEWIVMSKMPGTSLRDRWRDVVFSAKEEIVRRLALFCSETFRAQLRGIGNLFLDDTEASTSTTFSQKSRPVPGSSVQDCGSFRVQRIVSSEFIWDSHIHAEVSRGPFKSSKDWLLARLSLAEMDCRKRLSRFQNKNSPTLGQADGSTIPEDERENEPEEGEDENKTEGEEEDEKDEGDGDDEDEDEDDLEELEHIMDIISRLRRHLDDFFPPPGSEPERTMILHDDLSRQNILVNDDGNLTAVVDWECISALPLWIACQIPPLLQGKPRNEEPVKTKYQHDEDGNVVELFWEHLDDYELTQLRRVFLGEMERLQPEWVEIFESSQRQRDFDLAVSSCSDSFLIRRIRNWLDDMEKGVEDFQGLEERIDNASL
ncbi:phosphotransferase enzyme family-domain-containing protein [Corynascus novoguineensis]|uniref:Phosphotransferase enzyme family-domain-containing protein n=1 Tax=Corynascus novoguineensis TaxID=1126955 RepID=A0AAN7CQR6_9PEZI|nr:phosphotransferase enzyme family-domain-containing protein [Corynascus novoguineensis]